MVLQDHMNMHIRSYYTCNSLSSNRCTAKLCVYKLIFSAKNVSKTIKHSQYIQFFGRSFCQTKPKYVQATMNIQLTSLAINKLTDKCISSTNHNVDILSLYLTGLNNTLN